MKKSRACKDHDRELSANGSLPVDPKLPTSKFKSPAAGLPPGSVSSYSIEPMNVCLV